LRRTAVGPFNVSQAHLAANLEQTSREARDQALLPADSLIDRLPRVALAGALEKRFLQGQTLSAAGYPSGTVRVYSEGDRFLGVAEVGMAGELHPKRLINLQVPSGTGAA
jgi:tRNA U55 pseudouridine synthase TruB